MGVEAQAPQGLIFNESHITYPPDPPQPPPPPTLSLCSPSLSASLSWWCPFCTPGGGLFPWLHTAAWEALSGGPRRAEGLNALVYPPAPQLPLPHSKMEAQCIIHAVWPVRVVNTLLMVRTSVMPPYWISAHPEHGICMSFVLQNCLWKLQDSRKNLQTYVLREKTQKKSSLSAHIDCPWMPSCTIDCTQQVDEWMSCSGFEVRAEVIVRGCRLPAAPAWYSLLPLTSSNWEILKK